MTNTLTQPPVLVGKVHESVHTRTAVNTDENGQKTMALATSGLTMHWQAGELRVVHRYSSVPSRATNRQSTRGMRSRL